MPATVSDDYQAQADDAEVYEEVQGDAFAPVHDFEENDTLIGVYQGSREVETKKGARTIHSFLVNGEEVEAWGAAILNDRLKGLEDQKVKIVRPGDKLPTNSGGSAWNFKVFVAKAALAGGEA